MKTVPSWINIQPSVDDLIEKKLLTVESEKLIHNEYSNLKIMIEKKIDKWNNEKIVSEERWIEVFNESEINDISFKNFATLIEYAYTIPG